MKIEPLHFRKHIDLAANYGWHQVFYVCFVDFLGKAWLHWLCILSIMAAAIISILYSYFFYKKKLATGEGLKIQYNTKKCDISDHRNFRYCVYYMDFVLGKHSDSL